MKTIKQTQTTNTNRDVVVSTLRVVALLCIVMHHSMTIFSGWPPVSWEWQIGETNIITTIICNSLRTFGLGMFTFISGYVLYYQKQKNRRYICFLWKKIKRIIMPCLFFALLYYIIFPTMMYGSDPINGTHLWYLPMLFFCILSLSITVFNPKLWWTIICVYLFALILRKFFVYRTLCEFISYYPIFTMGFLTNALVTDGEAIIQKIKKFFVVKNKMLCYVIVLLIILFLDKILRCFYFESNSIAVSIIIATIFLVLKNTTVTLNNNLLFMLDKDSYIIYLIHQFVINIIVSLFHQEINATILSSLVIFIVVVIISVTFAEIFYYIKALIQNKVINEK